MEEEIEESFLRVLDLAFDVREDPTYFSGIVKSEALLAKFEDELHRLGMKFSVKCRSKRINPGSTKSKRVLFEFKSGHKVPFLGHPFTIEDTLYKDCHLGGRERNSDHQITSINGDQNVQPSTKNRYTKKQGCEGTFVIKKLHVYEGIEVAKGENKPDSLTIKELALQKVKSGDFNTSCWFCFQITKPEFHNHNFGEATQRCQMIHPQLVEKIKELVRDGVRKVDNIKNILDAYVKSDILKDSLVKPTASNTSYFPSMKAVRNAVSRAVQSEKYHKIDQGSLAKFVEENWCKDQLFYRPYSKDAKEGPESTDCPEDYIDTFLLVHQAPYQQAILKRYGNAILLDAAYRTIRYGVPLFFLVVKTNFGHMVVATFVVQFETDASLAEALQLIRKWNPEWTPRYILSGSGHAEVATVAVFPEAEHFLCGFHRQASWSRWLQKNVSSTKASEELFQLWQKVADSIDTKALEVAMGELARSRTWNESKKAQNYFTELWMAIIEKWVRLHRPFELEYWINMNNGAETLSKFLGHHFLVHHTNKTVGILLDVVVKCYLREQQSGYVQANITGQSPYSHEDVPEWLQHRPHGFIRHVINRYSCASKDFHHINISAEQEMTIFVVKSSSEDFPEEAWCSVPSYKVDLGKPSCTCSDFNKWFFPCKHICAVLIFVPDITVECFPSQYLDSPYLTVDENTLLILPKEDNTIPNSESKVDQCDHCYQQVSEQMEPYSLEFLLANKAVKCREILQQISSLTYLINDPVKLERIAQQLHVLLTDMTRDAVCDGELYQTNNCSKLKRRDSNTYAEDIAQKKTKTCSKFTY